MAGVSFIALWFVAWVSLTAQPTLTPFQEQKARALLRAQLSCLGCHELDGEGGRSAPSLSTVGQRRSAAYVRAMIENPQSLLPGVAMPTPALPAATLDLIVRFVARNAHGSDARVRGASERSSSAPEGAALYSLWCASCHGGAGRGDGPNAPFLPVAPAMHASAARMRERSDDALYDAIAGGGIVMGKSARMPAFGRTLSRAEIHALVRHIRALCRCEGPAWSRPGDVR